MPSQIFGIYIFRTAGPLVVTARQEKHQQQSTACCQLPGGLNFLLFVDRLPAVFPPTALCLGEICGLFIEMCNVVFVAEMYIEFSVICEKMVGKAESSFTVSNWHRKHEKSAEFCAIVLTSDTMMLEPDSLWPGTARDFFILRSALSSYRIQPNPDVNVLAWIYQCV